MLNKHKLASDWLQKVKGSVAIIPGFTAPMSRVIDGQNTFYFVNQLFFEALVL